MHITPGHNGWTHDAKRRLNAIAQKEREKIAAEKEPEKYERRMSAELQFYEDNHCYPHQTGYCGTETDAHFYER